MMVMIDDNDDAFRGGDSFAVDKPNVVYQCTRYIDAHIRTDRFTSLASARLNGRNDTTNKVTSRDQIHSAISAPPI